MNNEYLLRAKKVIPDVKTLIVLASKRATSLASGKSRPMVRCKEDSFLDIALLEIAEGKVTAVTNKPGDGMAFLNELEVLKGEVRASEESPREPGSDR